ncbi:MAG: hypothetical protein AAB793_01465 [Patescibacteria group bacterium]
MRSKIVYIFIGALLVFIIGYFTLQSFNKKENPLPKTSSININESANLNSTVSTNSSELSNTNAIDAQPQNVNQSGEVDPDAVLFDKAYAAGDRAVCDQIKGAPSKLLCNVYIINAQAKEKKDPKICDEIKDEFYHTDCLDNLTIYLAKLEENKAKCGELIDKKRSDECRSAAQ